MAGQIYKADGRTLVGRYDSGRVFRSGHACTFIGRFSEGIVMEGGYSEREIATYDESGDIFAIGGSEAAGHVSDGNIFKGSDLVGKYVGDEEGAAAAGYLLLIKGM